MTQKSEMSTHVGWRQSLCQIKLKPDYNEALDFLSHLEIEELQTLLNDDKYCDNIVKDLKQLKEMEYNKEMQMASIRSLAEFNLARQPQLTKGKQRIQELSEEGEIIYKKVEARFEELLNHDKIQTTLNKLQTARADIEEESETVVAKFLDGDIDVEDFLQQFFSRRKLMHLRRIKADKMADMVKKKEMSSFRRDQSSAKVPSGTRRDHQTSRNSEVPYPVSAVSVMPMSGTENI